MRNSVCGVLLFFYSVSSWSQQPQGQTLETPAFSITADRGVAAAPVDAEWWQQFHDQELEKLVVRAAKSNLDLRAAVARVAQARSNVYIARADGLPQVDASVSASRDRFRDVAAQSRTSYEIVPIEDNNFQGGFNLSWEIDVFGRIRNEVRAAKFDAIAADENRHDVLVALLGDVGRYYADLRGTNSALRSLSKTLRSSEISLHSRKAGLMPAWELVLT